MSQNLRKVDQTGIKTGMALTIVFLLLGFVLNSWLIVAFVALAQLTGALALPIAPYRLIYENIVKGRLAQPNVIPDNPEPHRFAQLVASIFDAVAATLLLVNVPVIPWVLVGIVVVLANLNLWLNFCMGCWMYYQFNRLGVPGFAVAPIQE